MKYNFKEAQLPKNFAGDFMHQEEKKLAPSGVLNIIGASGVGLSFIARFLAIRTNSIYVDIASLVKPTKKNFFTLLLDELGVKKVTGDDQELLNSCRIKIPEVLQKEKQLLFIFNRFDDLGKEIDAELLSNIRTLRHVAADKISIIFISHKPLYQISENAVSGANLDMFSNFLYFKGYSRQDLKMLIKIFSPELMSKLKKDSKAYVFSGGNYQLFKLLLKSQAKLPRDDVFVNLSLKKIYENLSYSQKKLLQKIVFKNTISEMDQELIDTGLVRENKSGFVLFTELFGDYIKDRSKMKLPFKERKLFRLLKRKEGQVVDKEVLFSQLWNENEQDRATDWALNALIYRLRKNPYFIARGFAIESYKKIGYSLIKK